MKLITQKRLKNLLNSHYQGTAIRVALVVGSILFMINHGQALIAGKMNRTRWVSGILTYCVPYCVSLHGQQQGNKSRKNGDI
jgi:hypothetical protein